MAKIKVAICVWILLNAGFLTACGLQNQNEGLF